jgi:hypothetical protein
VDDQDVRSLPYPKWGGLEKKTVGEVVDNLIQRSAKLQSALDNQKRITREVCRERDEALESLKSKETEIDSFKVLDMLTRSSLISKLSISEDSELGKTMAEALTSALTVLTLDLRRRRE